MSQGTLNKAILKLLHDKAEISDSKDLSKPFKFILKGNNELKKLIAYVASNIIIKYSAMDLEEDNLSLFYENQIEQRVVEMIFLDMELEEFKLLPLLIDLVGEEQLRDICLNRDLYLKKIAKVIAKQEEYRSCLLSRFLDRQLRVTC